MRKLRIGKFELCIDGHAETNFEEIFNDLLSTVTLTIPSAPNLKKPSIVSVTDRSIIQKMIFAIRSPNKDNPFCPVRAGKVLRDHLSQYGISVDPYFSNVLQYGRTTVLLFASPYLEKGVRFVGVAAKNIKWVADHEAEPRETLARELQIQSLLATDKNIRSAVPHAIGYVEKMRWRDDHPTIFFGIPEGYYHYLSDIENNTTFENGLCKAAHDLGYLLKKYGLVFPNLISVFHDLSRPYTMLPKNTKAYDGAGYGGMPGEMHNIIGKTLYENIGASGLRDLGDLAHIREFTLRGSQRQPDLTLSDPLKVAHFISLYLMVFTILIGNRSRRMESKETCENIAWARNHHFFMAAIAALLEGCGIPIEKLSQEERDYINLEKIKGKQKKQPAQKYNDQLRFAFTQHKQTLMPLPEARDKQFACRGEVILQINLVARTEEDFVSADYTTSNNRLKEIYGTDKAHWFVKGSISSWPAVSYNNQHDFFESGSLGNLSGINPLVSATKYALRTAQIVLTHSEEIFPRSTSLRDYFFRSGNESATRSTVEPDPIRR